MSNFASAYMKYINHLEQINDAAISKPEAMIREVEDSYHEHLRNIARNIHEQHAQVRLLMLAGPSSSGKTTTAHMLQHYLSDFSIRSVIISLDNFYRGKQDTPLLPDGTPNYEIVDALNVEKVKQCLSDVVTTGTFHVPNYRFALGTTEGADTVHHIGDGDLVIIEGIHALNPIFTAGLPADSLVRLYVSVKQMIKDVNGEVFSPMDLRLVRRIVRDMRERDTTPDDTIAMWQSVVDGENSYIRPYRMGADYTVNSIHLYEPCVLRTIAIPVLRDIPQDSPSYQKARMLESRLMRFEPLPCTLVPENSMLREFIGRGE